MAALFPAVQDGPDNRAKRRQNGEAENLYVIERCVAATGGMILRNGSAQMKHVHGNPGADKPPGKIDGFCQRRDGFHRDIEYGRISAEADNSGENGEWLDKGVELRIAESVDMKASGSRVRLNDLVSLASGSVGTRAVHKREYWRRTRIPRARNDSETEKLVDFAGLHLIVGESLPRCSRSTKVRYQHTHVAALPLRGYRMRGVQRK